jgi:CDP-diacylglycerol--serine O-phosphatidyltransferase
VKRIHLLPNLLTLGNAFCGLLALAKGIDALAYQGVDPLVFHRKMEVACALVFGGMVFDVLDGFAARLTRSASAFGAQLDSFADALTFGVVPALLAKILIEHETPDGSFGTSRVHFLAAAAFALMAILRLVRFNLEADSKAPTVPSVARVAGAAGFGGVAVESDEDDLGSAPPVRRRKADFSGLPSPVAAGAVASLVWLYLILSRPELETSEGTATPTRRFLQLVDYSPDQYRWLLDWLPGVCVLVLPLLGLLMVSHVRYPHLANLLAPKRRSFFSLVAIVFAAFLLYLAPVPVLALCFWSFVAAGLVKWLAAVRRGERAAVFED